MVKERDPVEVHTGDNVTDPAELPNIEVVDEEEIIIIPLPKPEQSDSEANFNAAGK